jgi:hypothetical protein
MRALLIALVTFPLLAPLAAVAAPAIRTLTPPPYIGGKTAQARDTAIEIAKLIRAELRSHPPRYGELKVYAEGGLKGSRISVYGVTEADVQDRVVKRLQANSQKNKWKPIHITFFEKESFVRSGNGLQRSGEVKLHAVVVE